MLGTADHDNNSGVTKFSCYAHEIGYIGPTDTLLLNNFKSKTKAVQPDLDTYR